MAGESVIRDNLAKNLRILEHGLSLVETEHHLRNKIGAKGYVDILARDAFGCMVIIEIKRREAAARQTLNELHKYIALFSIEHGIKPDKIRCFVVSTTWHELLIPLAEFVQSTGYQTSAFELTVGDNGDILRACVLDVPNLPAPLKIFHHHAIYLFQAREARDEAAESLADAVINAGAQSSCVVDLDYLGSNSAVRYRHACYVVPADLPSHHYKQLETVYRSENELEDDDVVEPGSVEQELLTQLNDHGIDRDDYEIGYPEKFASITSTGWSVRRITRRGRMNSAALYPDRDLVRLCAGVEGENSQIFNRIVSPRLTLAWSETKQGAFRSLQGNTVWLQHFNDFCTEIERSAPRASVSVLIYNPLNIPVWLFKLAATGTSKYIPEMQLVAADEASGALTVLTGFVAWNGNQTLPSVRAILDGIVSDISEYFAASHFGVAWELDPALMNAFCLRYVVAREVFERTGGDSTHCAKHRIDFDPAIGNFPLDEYLLANAPVIHEFISLVSSCSGGL